MTIDLKKLPPPAIIEELDYEQIRAELLADFQARYPDHAALLESDPAVKLIEVYAYRELLLRQRVNDAVRAGLLAFAGGADLDHLAAWWGVTRLAGEEDERLRLRVQLRSEGFSAAGPEEHYRYWALTASLDVLDASVTSPAPGLVHIAILGRDGDGTASAELLDSVRAVITRRDVRVFTDTVTVDTATIVTIPIVARVWLYPHMPEDLFVAARDTFPAAFAAARGLGWDVTRSWISAALHPAGVYRVVVDSPADDVLTGKGECAALGEVSITLEGRAR